MGKLYVCFHIMTDARIPVEKLGTWRLVDILRDCRKVVEQINGLAGRIERELAKRHGDNPPRIDEQ